jgi:lysophospholipid acyltransferase (LPLAT)-like uncharacterized protein
LAKYKSILKRFLKTLLNHNLSVLCITKIIQLYLEFVLLTSSIKINTNKEAINILNSNKVCFLTLWHGRIIVFPKIMQKFGKFKVLTSLHKDGKYVDKFIRLYGHETIRGSSYKGSLSATKNIINSIKNKESIVITPDGPRGPKYKVNSAITNLASKFKIPIISISFASSKAKILKSWDEFTIPLPFSKILVDISAPTLFNEKQNSKLEILMIKQMRDLENQL